MAVPLRPVVTVVLRLWHEPGMPEGDAGWRGSLRPLESSAAPAGKEIAFHGLENLPDAVQALLPPPGLSGKADI